MDLNDIDSISERMQAMDLLNDAGDRAGLERDLDAVLKCRPPTDSSQN